MRRGPVSRSGMMKKPSIASSTWCRRRRRPGTRPGPPPWWPRRWGTCRSITCGECCVSIRSTCKDDAPICVSTDPEFAAKAADIVGLYLDPPENAVVVCVDEKPSIQALERAQGYVRLPRGAALSGFSHRYQRHGTTTLFAALEVATGHIQAGHAKRRRRREFLDFMNDVVAAYPAGQALHVILDNLNTHKPKRDRWLARHPNVHFHFTPTNACWLNLIEIWFSILSRRALHGASFTSPRQLRNAIAAYNAKAHPFEWKKQRVYQGRLHDTYAELCN